jgi:hypothetical protein
LNDTGRRGKQDKEEQGGNKEETREKVGGDKGKGKKKGKRGEKKSRGHWDLVI